ncbi:MAG: multicopper oxidase domain-containing protein [Phycisphaerales bacterium]
MARLPILLTTTAALISFGGSSARAQSVEFLPAADNTIFSESDSVSNGAGQYFFAGRTNQNPPAVRRGLIRFNVAGAIPDGSTVTSVQLTLYMSRSKPGTDPVSIHRATSAWGEGTSDTGSEEGQGAPATLNDATWRYRFYNPANPPGSTSWIALGGDFTPTASATIPVGNEGSYSWGSNAAMVADAQTWVDSPAANHGWIVIGNESANRTATRFDSREFGEVSKRPRLVVNFTPPASTGACCLVGGACQILTSAQCSSQGGAYQGNGTICSPNPCPQPTGACCLSGGACSVLTSAQCATQGGVFQGTGTGCSPNPCPQTTGACCFNDASCVVLTPAGCTGMGGVYRGDNTACTAGLCPLVLLPFVDALPIPAVAQPTSGSVGGVATYTIPVREFNHPMHRDLPPSRVWGYGGTFPGPTIVAGRDLPVTVTWINDLRDAMGNLRTQHYLPVDLCIHGPNMFGPTARIVTHLHGGHVPMASDGYPYDTILPGQQTPPIVYPNNQPPGTLWYHDHALGITRLNVYMGLAGFYLLFDPFEQGLGLPSGQNEIGLAIQDRSFNPDGTLKYPAMWEDHFFGEVMIVNGKVWPYLNVRQGKYRFRLLNGCTSRTLTLSLSNGATFHQIGTDLGLLPAPVPLTSLTLGGGERADVVVDFAPHAPGTEITLTNSAPAPYPGSPAVGVIPNVMKFVVTSQGGHTNPLPATLRPVAAIPEAQSSLERTFELAKGSDPCTGSAWLINGLRFDNLTEFPRLDTTEIWSFINRSGVMHPMHMHLVQFLVLDRQAFDIVGGQVTPVGPRIPPPPEEAGWKDTVKVGPQEIVRVITRFEDYLGLYPYHCHILEHEDHEMMRQFKTTCYANCDGSDTPPVLNVNDFSCFLNAYAAGNPYANCDGSSAPPVLNINDFVCFLNRFAAGCP